MEGQTDRADAEIAGSGETLSCASRGVAALAALAGGQLTLPTACQPWGCAGMCRSAPEMLPQPLGHSGRSWLLGGAAKPWEQCDRAPVVLAQTSWHCLQGMGSWKSRSYSGSPSLKKPPQGAGRGGCGIRQPRLIPACGIPALLSCLTPSSLRKGHKPREREASRAHGRCPTLRAQPRVWAKTGHPLEGTLVMSDAAAGAATSSLSPCPHSLTRGNFLARHNSSEKFMAHQGAVGQGCSLRERLQGFLLAESGFDAAHAALPCRSLPPAPSLAKAREGARGRLRQSSPQPTLPFLPCGSCGNAVLAGSGKACPVWWAALPALAVRTALHSCCPGEPCPSPKPSPQPLSALGRKDPSGEEHG